ncbi:MAG TPA: hypothetical protein VI793_13600 [Anaerolineales bacterium]|nr:hypothetical protein [Anaerolineales bacterium]
MSCGSPLGDLFYLADRLLYPHPDIAAPLPSHTSLMAEGPGVGVRAALYRMYGEGQISEEVFTALRTLADRDQLRPADLAVHRARARRRPDGHSDVEAMNALRGIRSRLAHLAQARAASEKVLANMEARVAGLGERIVGKEQAARDAVAVESDETAARSRLAEKAEFASSRDRLAAQAQALRADLARLDDLRAQLEAKAAELEAIQARIRLSEEVLK